MNAFAFSHNQLTAHEQVNLYVIAHQMKQNGLPEEFIASVIALAFEFEGIFDLLKLWSAECDDIERQEIIAEMQELMHDCMDPDKQKFIEIKLNDLELIAKNIRAFKDNLLTEVNARGGISKLSELTQIPQPSLSRFFNSGSMPQRITLLKIAKALELDAVKIVLPWVK